MAQVSKVKLGFKQSMHMLLPYIKKRIFEQVSSVALIVVYLILFQMLILGLSLANAGVIALGLGLVVLGLAFFMEGLLIGLMPLGEILGLQLPQKTKLPFILAFAFVLGLGATFAEPAIGVLKLAGASVKAWEAPLLYYLLNLGSGMLVISVGVGVGIAVLFGMLRFMYGWSLKPFIFVLIPLLSVITILSAFNANMLSISGLAWDTGGVTTGPVTVPLVLALGIGISRMSSKSDGGGGGFGVVTLASAFPILTVMALGFFLNFNMPAPQAEASFFARTQQSSIQQLFGDEAATERYVLQVAGPEGIAAWYGKPEVFEARIQALASSDKDRLASFGTESAFHTWMATRCPQDLLSRLVQAGLYTDPGSANASVPANAPGSAFDVLFRNFLGALQAIIPLSGLLLVVLLFIVREKLPKPDEVNLGIVLAVIGMALFSIGIELGLSNIGNQVGGNLPALYQPIYSTSEKKVFRNFDQDQIQTSINPAGGTESFFWVKEGKTYQAIPFESQAYDQTNRTYTWIPALGPLYGGGTFSPGVFILLIFAFFMGYAATMAEPALNALGMTVEDITVGTFKKKLLMQAVAIGVGIGIAVGVSKILYDIPIIWLLAPPYALLMFMTAMSSEDYVNIAWDSAGVTTGPVTVPLVLAMGLGIGTQMGIVEGFGILAAASVFPILSVLTVGLLVSFRRKKNLAALNGKGGAA